MLLSSILGLHLLLYPLVPSVIQTHHSLISRSTVE
jgi:hypothetical protein